MSKVISLLITFSMLCLLCTPSSERYRQIKVKDYLDKMKAGWVGQMVGVGWGGPTEFKWKGEIIPADQIPQWKPEMVNQHYQDDIYVEMTFLRTLEQYGFDVSIRQAGIDFANSRYNLWHANKAGRDNLRAGIAPPYSGHPKFNSHADDIDYQIEADYSGLIAPGLPQTGIELGEKFGRLMNYGDGLYGGQFVAGMYAAAFFESDIEKIIHAGLKCIPAGSQYHECISDVLNWYQQSPDNWQQTWQRINDKYHLNPDYRKFSCSGPSDPFNIDAKINGAYIVMGLLYGKGDPDSTIVISTRCGQDSDCNPSNAGGILFTTLGFSNLPDRFKSAIDNEPKFSFTEYNFAGLIAVCEKLARQAVVRAGGRVETDANGDEVFVIPVKEPQASALEQCWEPTPVPEAVNFTEEEMSKITFKVRKPEEFIRTWQVAGPYTQAGADALTLFNVVFPVEADPTQVTWQKMPVDTAGYHAWMIELDKFFNKENCVAYLRTQVWSEKERPAVLELGTDDGVMVWLNGELVHENNILRGHTAGEDQVKVNLRADWNTLLMKITQGQGGWEASACFCDEKGKALTDLKYKLD